MINNKDLLIDDLANSIADNLSLDPENKLLTKAMQQARIKANLEDLTQAFRKRVASGILLLSDHVSRLVKEDVGRFPLTLLDELLKLTGGQVDLAHRQESANLQELYGLSDEGLQGFYEVANDLYQKKMYGEASDILYFLALIKPDEPLHWNALGNAEYYNQKFDEAISAYLSALALGSEDLDLYLHISHCYEALKQEDEAIRIIESVLKAESHQPSPIDWRTKAENYLNALREKSR